MYLVNPPYLTNYVILSEGKNVSWIIIDCTRHHNANTVITLGPFVGPRRPSSTLL